MRRHAGLVSGRRANTAGGRHERLQARQAVALPGLRRRGHHQAGRRTDAAVGRGLNHARPLQSGGPRGAEHAGLARRPEAQRLRRLLATPDRGPGLGALRRLHPPPPHLNGHGTTHRREGLGGHGQFLATHRRLHDQPLPETRKGRASVGPEAPGVHGSRHHRVPLANRGHHDHRRTLDRAQHGIKRPRSRKAKRFGGLQRPHAVGHGAQPLGPLTRQQARCRSRGPLVGDQHQGASTHAHVAIEPLHIRVGQRIEPAHHYRRGPLQRPGVELGGAPAHGDPGRHARARVHGHASVRLQRPSHEGAGPRRPRLEHQHRKAILRHPHGELRRVVDHVGLALRRGRLHAKRARPVGDGPPRHTHVGAPVRGPPIHAAAHHRVAIQHAQIGLPARHPTALHHHLHCARREGVLPVRRRHAEHRDVRV